MLPPEFVCKLLYLVRKLLDYERLFQHWFMMRWMVIPQVRSKISSTSDWFSQQLGGTGSSARGEQATQYLGTLSSGTMEVVGLVRGYQRLSVGCRALGRTLCGHQYHQTLLGGLLLEERQQLTILTPCRLGRCK